MPPKQKTANKLPMPAEGSNAKATATKTTASKNKVAASMPPPPPPSKPPGILEPEYDALMQHYTNSVVQVGRIYKTAAKSKTLKVEHYLPEPPRSIQEKLFAELSQYDQMCDVIEAHLNRAIAVLQRDLDREETRLRLEAEKAARELEAKRRAEALKDIEMRPPATVNEGDPAQRVHSSPSGPSLVPLHRRQSKISLSTLHRNPFPLKLDLSSMRMSEDGGMSLGMGAGMSAIGGMVIPGLSRMHSPQQLSARPLGPEYNPELFAALTGAVPIMDNQGPHQPIETIDLTMDANHENVAASFMPVVDNSLGNSADKPIELDLDSTMSDMFGSTEHGKDSSEHMDISIGSDDVNAYFQESGSTDPNANTSAPAAMDSTQGDGMDMHILNALSQGTDFGEAERIMASLSGNGETPSGQAQSGGANAPTPGTIMAGLAESSNTSAPSEVAQGKMPASSNGEPGAIPHGDMDSNVSNTFDYSQIDMSNFGHLFNSDNMNMDMFGHLLNLNQGSGNGLAGVAAVPGSSSGAEGSKQERAPGGSTS